MAATGTFIGFTGLNPLPDGVPGVGGMEVGWRLARHARHHGYATEAARAALGVAFDNMGLPEIWSMTAVLNEPSQAVMRRLGLTETTRFDHPRIRNAVLASGLTTARGYSTVELLSPVQPRMCTRDREQQSARQRSLRAKWAGRSSGTTPEHQQESADNSHGR